MTGRHRLGISRLMVGRYGTIQMSVSPIDVPNRGVSAQRCMSHLLHIFPRHYLSTYGRRSAVLKIAHKQGVLRLEELS